MQLKHTEDGGFNMLIDLSELLSTEHKKQEFHVSIDMNEFKTSLGDYLFAGKEPLDIYIENTGKKELLINTSIHVSLYIPCDRCLEDVKNDFDIDVSKKLDIGKPISELDDRDEFSFISGSTLDSEKLVYNEILVNMPMKVLCSENCKGICNRCGANLNAQTCDCDKTELDPRMSKILDVFNNFKEV